MERYLGENKRDLQINYYGQGPGNRNMMKKSFIKIINNEGFFVLFFLENHKHVRGELVS